MLETVAERLRTAPWYAPIVGGQLLSVVYTIGFFAGPQTLAHILIATALSAVVANIALGREVGMFRIQWLTLGPMCIGLTFAFMSVVCSAWMGGPVVPGGEALLEMRPGAGPVPTGATTSP